MTLSRHSRHTLPIARSARVLPGVAKPTALPGDHGARPDDGENVPPARCPGSGQPRPEWAIGDLDAGSLDACVVLLEPENVRADFAPPNSWTRRRHRGAGLNADLRTTGETIELRQYITQRIGSPRVRRSVRVNPSPCRANARLCVSRDQGSRLPVTTQD